MSRETSSTTCNTASVETIVSNSREACLKTCAHVMHEVETTKLVVFKIFKKVKMLLELVSRSCVHDVNGSDKWCELEHVCLIIDQFSFKLVPRLNSRELPPHGSISSCDGESSGKAERCIACDPHSGFEHDPIDGS